MNTDRAERRFMTGFAGTMPLPDAAASGPGVVVFDRVYRAASLPRADTDEPHPLDGEAIVYWVGPYDAAYRAGARLGVYPDASRSFQNQHGDPMLRMCARFVTVVHAPFVVCPPCRCGALAGRTHRLSPGDACPYGQGQDYSIARCGPAPDSVGFAASDERERPPEDNRRSSGHEATP